MKKQIEKVIAEKKKLMTTLSHRVIIIMHPHITPLSIIIFCLNFHTAVLFWNLRCLLIYCVWVPIQSCGPRWRMNTVQFYLVLSCQLPLWSLAEQGRTHTEILPFMWSNPKCSKPGAWGNPSMSCDGVLCSFWSLGVCYARHVFCPHHDSLKRKS